MSLKSKRNREKRKRERRQNYLKSLKRKSEMGSLDAEDIAIGPGGPEKMSEVLIEFVAPYTHLTDTEEEYRKLLTMAVCAWNMSLLPLKDQQGMIAKILQEGRSESDPEATAGMLAILGTMMARKRTSFSENKRFILDFTLMETETGRHLSVISPLEPPTTP